MTARRAAVCLATDSRGLDDEIILTRHGHVGGINPERFRGRTELPLTELGRAQAKAVAARIAKTWNIAKVYTSPMGRCVATGQEIAKACCITSEPLEALMILIMANGSRGPLTRFGPHGQNSLPRGIRRLISCDSRR